MALLKCPDCGKSVSDKAVTCPSCGSPIGGGGSVGNTAFEKRIEQYKTNGYKMGKRNGDIVKMGKINKSRWIGAITFIVIWFIVAVVLFSISSNYGGFMFQLVLALPLFFMVLAIGSTVTLSLTKTGKIEETGNVLKKK